MDLKPFPWNEIKNQKSVPVFRQRKRKVAAHSLSAPKLDMLICEPTSYTDMAPIQLNEGLRLARKNSEQENLNRKLYAFQDTSFVSSIHGLGLKFGVFSDADYNIFWSIHTFLMTIPEGYLLVISLVEKHTTLGQWGF